MDALKTYATWLAGTLGAQSDQLGEVVRALGLVDHDERAFPPPLAEAPDVIGAWRKSASIPGQYDRAEGDPRWPDLPTIAPKRQGTKRVVWLGESVAAGFFYEPAYTPASAMGALLGEMDSSVEVLDLSRVDLTGIELLKLLHEVRWLEPDAITIVAGNNWAWAQHELERFDRDLRRSSADTLRSSGLAVLRTHIDGVVDSFAAAVMREIEAFSRATGIPIVFALPESNLASWHPSPVDAPRLASGNLEWERLRADGTRALEEGDLQRAHGAATAMIKLDDRTAASGYFIMGQVQRKIGRFDDARLCLEEAREVHLGIGIDRTRATYASVQRAVRAFRGEGVAVVDMPRVIERHLKGEVADERAFLDSCHMTSEGLRLVAGHVAAEVARILGVGRGESGDELAARASAPSGRIEALAYLGAAIHNARWGQPPAVIAGHCRRAVEHDPQARDLAAALVNLFSSALPGWMNPRLGALLEQGLEGSKYLKQCMIGPARGIPPLWGEDLIDALASVTSSAEETKARAIESWLREHRGAFGIDLLSDRYRQHWADLGRSWSPSAGYFKALAPVSRFPLCKASAGEVDLEIVCRAPADVKIEGAAEIWVDGQPVMAIELSAGWTRWFGRIHGGALRRGVHAIEVRWNTAPVGGDQWLIAAAEELERGRERYTDFCPVYGEVSLMRALFWP